MKQRNKLKSIQGNKIILETLKKIKYFHIIKLAEKNYLDSDFPEILVCFNLHQFELKMEDFEEVIIEQ